MPRALARQPGLPPGDRVPGGEARAGLAIVGDRHSGRPAHP
ncbi:hypothetical protein ABZ760_29590 [Streptomyces sp. NPDC006658]